MDNIDLTNAELLLADNRGKYIPQHFAEDFDMAEWHVSADDAAVLLAGPDNNWYWEAWDDVLSTAYWVDSTGKVWTLYQDGDLWAVPDTDTNGEE